MPLPFNQLPYWKDLSHQEQKRLFTASQELDRASSTLEQGHHIFELHKILKEKGRWLNYIDTLHNKVSRKSAYRFKDTWEIASEFWPLPFLQAMRERGIDPGIITVNNKVGKFTAVVKTLGGIPRTTDKQEQNVFIDRMLDAYRKWRAEIRWPKSGRSPDELTKRVFKAARVQYRKMPEASRKEEVAKLMAWLSAEFDVQPGSIRPLPPPRAKIAARGKTNV